jgi:hypothetical protein
MCAYVRGHYRRLLWIVCGGGRRSLRCRMRRLGGRWGGIDGRVQYRHCVERKTVVVISLVEVVRLRIDERRHFTALGVGPVARARGLGACCTCGRG